MRIIGFILLATSLFPLWPANSMAQSAKQCLRILNTPGGKELKNSCNACMVVTIERKRPTNTAPVYRTLTVPKKSRIPLSFHGPGRARIMSAKPCGAKYQDQGSLRPKQTPAGLKCVRLVRQRNGGLGLVNFCSACRTTIIERTGANAKKTFQAFLVEPGKPISLPSKGAKAAKIIREKACR